MKKKTELEVGAEENTRAGSGRFRNGRSLMLYFLQGSVHFFAISILFSCFASLLDLVIPKIIQYTVDTVIGGDVSAAPALVNRWIDGMGGVQYLRSHLIVVAGAVAVAALAGAVCRYFYNLFNSIGAETLVRRMRDRLYGHIIRLPFSWHGENHTGDIIQRCTSDVENVKVFVSEQLTSLVRVIMLIVLSMYFMLNIHVRLALAAGIFIPVMILGSLFFYGRIGGIFARADAEEGRLSSIAQENLTGVRVVRAFGREQFERERFEKQNGIYTDLWFRLMRVLAAFWVSGNIIATVRTMTVAILGAFFCVKGSLTAGGFIAFISYNTLMSLPVRSLGRVISEMSRAGISVERLRYIMNAGEESDSPDAMTPPMDRDIVFEHVSYSYGTGKVLKDVSFSVKAGTTVGILGGTGSGKSTLMALLDRLYDLPSGKDQKEEESGRITIGGVDISKIRRSWLREHIGMVLQEPYLFSGTLAENISIARPEADCAQIRSAARIASLDGAIRHFPSGYNTYVGERGVTLSGGQKQRAAIAQTLIRQAPIMIFDDSLSAVDAETDARIRKALAESTGSATVILIAHRITTLMNADKIIVLDKGRVVQQGTHEELASQEGLYRRVYELQSGAAGEV